MTPLYRDSAPSSTHVRRRWRIAAAALGAVLMAGLAGAVLVASGAFDPPRAGPLVWTMLSGDTPPALPTPPYTLEAEAVSRSPWGMRLSWLNGELGIQIRPDGYVSVSADGAPDWFPFLHVQPSANRLELDVQADGAAVLRVNEEVAWRGDMPDTDAITVRSLSAPDAAIILCLYAPD